MEETQFRKELYEIIKQHKKEDYARIIEEKASYSCLYHLSEIRGNLIDWIPITKEMRVLERNAECGALTGKLLEKAGEVICLTEDEISAEIIKERYRDAGERLRVFPEDIPVAMHFDVILIAGNVYRFQEELIDLRKLLKKDGRLILADANRIGLKYLAGCQEEYRGGYFSGVEGYDGVREEGSRRTAMQSAEGAAGRCYTKGEYTKLLKNAGFEGLEFYYPYPDHKFPVCIYSDAWLPRKGELSENRRNFERDRLQLFDERKVYDTLLEEGLFGAFSNSFLIVAGNPGEAKDQTAAGEQEG